MFPRTLKSIYSKLSLPYPDLCCFICSLAQCHHISSGSSLKRGFYTFPASNLQLSVVTSRHTFISVYIHSLLSPSLSSNYQYLQPRSLYNCFFFGLPTSDLSIHSSCYNLSDNQRFGCIFDHVAFLFMRWCSNSLKCPPRLWMIIFLVSFSASQCFLLPRTSCTYPSILSCALLLYLTSTHLEDLT